MKYIALLVLTLFSIRLHAQIEKVTVELYYISDYNDSTDTTGINVLKEGSKTYRIFVDLMPGCKILKIYGDQFHQLRFTSTDLFYNNVDRPNANFGYLINKNWFPDNPTLALDSWITLGLATKTELGVLKSDDTDGSFIGGVNNYGGSASVPGGLLINNDPLAGTPLTVADGLIANDSVLSQWIDYGFRDMNGDDTTVLGAINTGSEFLSNDIYLQQNSGLSGADTAKNEVLIAQLTTLGELSFEINLEVQVANGDIVQYVADDDTLIQQGGLNEQISPYLKYPPACGCTDPDFLEYSNAYACNIQDSCLTPVIFGCMDPSACNFDPMANYSVEELCCYPGHCNDRDISFVCPDIANQERQIQIYPNPVDDRMNILFKSLNEGNITVSIYNTFGRVVQSMDMKVTDSNVLLYLNVQDIKEGIYMVRVDAVGFSESKMIYKK